MTSEILNGCTVFRDAHLVCVICILVICKKSRGYFSHDCHIRGVDKNMFFVSYLIKISKIRKS